MVKLYDMYSNTRIRKRYTPNYSFFVQFVVKMKLLKIRIGLEFLKDDEHSNGPAIQLVSKYSGNK